MCYAAASTFTTFSLRHYFTVVKLNISFDKWVTETLVRKSVSEISDFPSYGMQMVANYFYRVMMSLSVCAV